MAKDLPAALIAEQLAEDHAREFHALILEMADANAWTNVVACVAEAMFVEMPGEPDFVIACRDFAADYGWPAVLSAIAHAMRQQEAEAKETWERR